MKPNNTDVIDIVDSSNEEMEIINLTNNRKESGKQQKWSENETNNTIGLVTNKDNLIPIIQKKKSLFKNIADISFCERKKEKIFSISRNNKIYKKSDPEIKRADLNVSCGTRAKSQPNLEKNDENCKPLKRKRSKKNIEPELGENAQKFLKNDKKTPIKIKKIIESHTKKKRLINTKISLLNTSVVIEKNKNIEENFLIDPPKPKISEPQQPFFKEPFNLKIFTYDSNPKKVSRDQILDTKSKNSQVDKMIDTSIKTEKEESFEFTQSSEYKRNFIVKEQSPQYKNDTSIKNVTFSEVNEKLTSLKTKITTKTSKKEMLETELTSNKKSNEPTITTKTIEPLQNNEFNKKVRIKPVKLNRLQLKNACHLQLEIDEEKNITDNFQNVKNHNNKNFGSFKNLVDGTITSDSEKDFFVGKKLMKKKKVNERSKSLSQKTNDIIVQQTINEPIEILGNSFLKKEYEEAYFY